MRCKFCFATFKDLGIVKHDFQRSSQIIRQLAAAGFEKINFAGGEPTLVKELPALAKLAKELGMTTTIVTNGTKFAEKKVYDELIPYLDWIALSIDSTSDSVNLASGRALHGKTVLTKAFYLELIKNLRKDKKKIKINTVVSRFNLDEDFNHFIEEAKPDRWKILQAMPVEGQNSDESGFEVSKNEFLQFINRNNKHNVKLETVPEDIELIRGSYIMVNPEGCFFDSTNGKHTYSNSIIQVGVEKALSQINFDYELFLRRGGMYEWKQKTNRFPERITISGEVASGKSSVGKLLGSKLQYSFTSLGNKIRTIAESEGLSIVEFQKKCTLDKTMDLKIDTEFANECNQSSRAIIDYRMGYKFIEKSYNIFLKVSEEEAEKRLRQANRLNETHETIRERNDSFLQQFINAYGENYSDPNNHDLVIDTDKFNSPEEISNHIFQKLEEEFANGN